MKNKLAFHSRLALGALALSLAAGCGGGGGDSGGTGPGGGSSGGPTLTSDLRVTTQTQDTVELAWGFSGAAQYRLYRTRTTATESTRELLATVTASTYRDSGLQLKTGYGYQVLGCRNATEPDNACAFSGYVQPFVTLSATLGGLYAPEASLASAATLAADFGLTRVGARWVFAEPSDATLQPLLDYTVREVIGTKARLAYTSADYADPLITVGEITADGRAGLYISQLGGFSGSVVMPYLQGYDFGAVEPLLLPAVPTVGQTWRYTIVTNTNCLTLDGRAASCAQDVVVTTRIVANTDTFASLCPHSPLATTLPALKAFKVEQTFEFTPREPNLFRAEPSYIQTAWLSPGYGFVARQRVANTAGAKPMLNDGNYCLIAASGQ